MAEATLSALHGDRWRSPRWAVTFGGAPADLSQWHILAQARQNTEATEVVFEWQSGDPGIVFGSADVRLADGTVVTTGTLQLLIRPGDWEQKPRKWSGVLDVELSSDDSDDPEDRVTIVKKRKFEIVPDTARV